MSDKLKRWPYYKRRSFTPYLTFQQIIEIYLPEDLVDSNPSVSYFLFFFWTTRPGYYVQHGYFFLKILGSILTQIRPEFVFLVPVLIVSKWYQKFSKKYGVLFTSGEIFTGSSYLRGTYLIYSVSCDLSAAPAPAGPDRTQPAPDRTQLAWTDTSL